MRDRASSSSSSAGVDPPSGQALLRASPIHATTRPGNAAVFPDDAARIYDDNSSKHHRGHGRQECPKTEGPSDGRADKPPDEEPEGCGYDSFHGGMVDVTTAAAQ